MKTPYGGFLLMLDGYTFSKMTSSYIYYCSKKEKGCKAKVKLDKEMKVSNYKEIHHQHPPPLYKVTKDGRYIKIRS